MRGAQIVMSNGSKLQTVRHSQELSRPKLLAVPDYSSRSRRLSVKRSELKAECYRADLCSRPTVGLFIPMLTCIWRLSCLTHAPVVASDGHVKQTCYNTTLQRT